MGIVLVIRHLLIAENKRRDAEYKPDTGYDDVYIERLAQDGSGVMEKVKVDKVSFYVRISPLRLLISSSFLFTGIPRSDRYTKSRL
jgi:hypothetical protein